MRIHQPVKSPKRILLLDCDLPETKRPSVPLLPSGGKAYLVRAEIGSDSSQQKRRSPAPLYRKVWYLLPWATLVQQYRSVAVEQSPEKVPFQAGRKFGPRCRETLRFRQTQRPKERSDRARRKYDSQRSPAILQANSVWLVDQCGNQFYDLGILRANFDRVPEEATITPDQSKHPCEFVGPAEKEFLIERVEPVWSGETRSTTAAEARPLAHWFPIGNKQCCARTVHERSAPLTTETSGRVALLPLVWLAAVGALVRHHRFHRNIIAPLPPYSRFPHLGLDGPLHARNATATRARKERERRTAAGQEAMAL